LNDQSGDGLLSLWAWCPRLEPGSGEASVDAVAAVWEPAEHPRRLDGIHHRRRSRLGNLRRRTRRHYAHRRRLASVPTARRTVRYRSPVPPPSRRKKSSLDASVAVGGRGPSSAVGPYSENLLPNRQPEYRIRARVLPDSPRDPELVGPPAAEQDAPRWSAAYGAVSSDQQALALTVQGTGKDRVVLEARRSSMSRHTPRRAMCAET
jgi:hypothetical protein